MGISKRQLRGGRPKSDPNVGSLHSSIQDSAASAQVAQMKAELKANVSGFGSMQQFLSDPLGVPTVPASITELLRQDVAKQAAALKPIVKDRAWATLYSSVPDGTSLLCARVTDDLAYSAQMPFSDVETVVQVSDSTGSQEIPVQGFTISDDDLRRSDDAVARIIDRNVTETLTRDANDVARQVFSAKQALGLAEAVSLVFNHAALYPVIWFADKLEPTPSGAAFIVRFAIQWVYEPSLDEDDDEEDD